MEIECNDATCTGAHVRHGQGDLGDVETSAILGETLVLGEMEEQLTPIDVLENKTQKIIRLERIVPDRHRRQGARVDISVATGRRGKRTE